MGFFSEVSRSLQARNLKLVGDVLQRFGVAAQEFFGVGGDAQLFGGEEGLVLLNHNINFLFPLLQAADLREGEFLDFLSDFRRPFAIGQSNDESIFPRGPEGRIVN